MFVPIALLLSVSLVAAVPASISGPYYYIADGLETPHPFNPMPYWMPNIGNWVSLTYLNPADFYNLTNPVQQAFVDSAAYFNSLGKSVFLTIGGYNYISKWDWISNNNQSQTAGIIAGQIALQYNVGIEVMYCQTSSKPVDPTNGLVNFVQGFRSVCPMGKCLLTFSVSPAPAGSDWNHKLLPKIYPPSGKVGEIYGSGIYIDYINVMIVEDMSAQASAHDWILWYNDCSFFTESRATFSISAGNGDFGICSGDQDACAQVDYTVNTAVSWGLYGITTTAICPSSQNQIVTCHDWDYDCNPSAKGFQYLCSQYGTCK